RRCGNTAGDEDGVKAGKASSHGRAIVTPAPRRTARREMRWADFGVRLSILFTCLFLSIWDSFVQKLWTCDNCLHHGSKAIRFRRQLSLHALNRELIGELERPAESVRRQFAAEIVNEVFLAILADIGFEAVESGPLTAA